MDIKTLLDKYKNGTATEEEVALLESWYLTYEEPSADELSMEERIAAVDYVWEQLQPKRKSKVVQYWLRSAVAAAVLLVLVWVIYKPKTVVITPGGNRATLTLGNGKKIDLDSLKTGVVINAAAITYDDGAGIAGGGPQEMVLHTPRGGTYQVVLPDGSKVWLNAASMLKFPSVFEKERKVILDGEGYFEVAKDEKKPFVVEAGGQQVQVLGTAFNINAYGEEGSARTTLVNGSVRVGKVVLRPGEQVVSGVVSDVEVDEVVGWKNGYFNFENETLPVIMRKVARWYDVEVEFEGDVTKEEFGGRMTRYSELGQVLRKLELTGKVHFKVKGRKVIVTK